MMRFNPTKMLLSASLVLLSVVNVHGEDMEPTAEMSRSVKSEPFDKNKLHHQTSFSFQHNKVLSFEKGTGVNSAQNSINIQFHYEGRHSVTGQGRTPEEQMAIHTIKDNKGRSLIVGGTSGTFQPATYESSYDGRHFIGNASISGLAKPQEDATSLTEVSLDLLLNVVTSTRIIKLSPLADYIDKGISLPAGVVTVKSVDGTNIKIEMRGEKFKRGNGYKVYYRKADGTEIRRSGWGSSSRRDKITYNDRIKEALGENGYIEIAYPEETKALSFPVRLTNIPLSTGGTTKPVALDPNKVPVAEGMSFTLSELRRSRSRHVNFAHPNSSRPRESFSVRMNMTSSQPGIKISNKIPGVQTRETYQIEQILDDTGKNLIGTSFSPYLSISSSSSSSRLGYLQLNNLEFPANDAKSLKHIKGNVFVMMLKEYKSKQVDALADQLNKGIELKGMGVLKFTEHKERLVQVRSDFKDLNHVKYEFENPDGKRVSYYVRSSSANANYATQKLTLRSDLDPKATLRISYPTEKSVVRIPLALTDVPLYDSPKGEKPKNMPPANSNFVVSPQSMDMEDSSSLRFQSGVTNSSANNYMNLSLGLDSKAAKVIVPFSGSSRGEQGIIWEATDDTGKSLVKNDVYLSVNLSNSDGAPRQGRIGSISIGGLTSPSLSAKSIKAIKGWFRVNEVKSYKRHSIPLAAEAVGKTYKFSKHHWLRIESLKDKVLTFRTNFREYPGSGGFTLMYTDANGNQVSSSRSTSSSDSERIYTETFKVGSIAGLTLKTAYPEETVEVRLPIDLADIALSPSAAPQPAEEAQLRDYETAIESMTINQGFSVNQSNDDFRVHRGDNATMKLNFYHHSPVKLARYRNPAGGTPLFIDKFVDSTGKNLAAAQISTSLNAHSGKSNGRHRLGYAWVHNILPPAKEATHVTEFSGHVLFYELGEKTKVLLDLGKENFGKSHKLTDTLQLNLQFIEKKRVVLSYSDRAASDWVELKLRTADGKFHRRQSSSSSSGVYRMGFGVEPQEGDALEVTFPSSKVLVKVPFSYKNLKLDLPKKAPKPAPQMPADDGQQMQGEPAAPMGVGAEADG